MSSINLLYKLFHEWSPEDSKFKIISDLVQLSNRDAWKPEILVL